ncbi:MAG: methylmalonyl-CoA carboxyltransferase, partial [Bacteroidetes bacterium]|nr:methylmalonyl-CoA carboxyltransferase [Bacteroidota bacterium]
MIDKYKELEKRNLEAEIGGGQDRIDRQHAAGRKTARERLYDLIDPGTFVEFDKFVVHRTHDFDMEKSIISGDGVVTGYGKIDGRM